LVGLASVLNTYDDTFNGTDGRAQLCLALPRIRLTLRASERPPKFCGESGWCAFSSWLIPPPNNSGSRCPLEGMVPCPSQSTPILVFVATSSHVSTDTTSGQGYPHGLSSFSFVWLGREPSSIVLWKREVHGITWLQSLWVRYNRVYTSG